MKKRAPQKKNTSKSGSLISSAFGLCGAVIILLIILVIFSFVGLAISEPHTLLSPVAQSALYLSAFFGGFIAIKKNKGRDALLCGLVCGCFITVLYLIVFWISGLILDADSEPLSWLFRILIIPSSILGSFLGTIKDKKIPTKRKRKK